MTPQPQPPVSPPPSPQASPAARSVRSWLASLLLCIAATALTVWVSTYAYGSTLRISQVQGRVDRIELFPPDTGRPGESSMHYHTQLYVRTAVGQVKGPFKLAGDQRESLAGIQGSVRVMFDHNHLVAELKDDARTYVTIESWVRKRHISRAFAVIGTIILGVFALSQWLGFCRELRGKAEPAQPVKAADQP